MADMEGITVGGGVGAEVEVAAEGGKAVVSGIVNSKRARVEA